LLYGNRGLHRRHDVKKTVLMVSLILFFMSRTSTAADHSGCLSCHQYAGQAVMTEKGKLKITHIDEEQFLKSPHKDLGCQDCHKEISIMPPLEKPEIDCRSACHKGKKEGKRLKKYPLEKIHEGQQWAISFLENKSPCRICHNTYPHSKYKMTRAILNKHTLHLNCEVCHLDIKNTEKITYDWTGAESALFKGKPFGNYYDPLKDTLLKPQKAISRIGIYMTAEGKKEALMKKWNKELAKKLKVPVKNWNEEQSIRVMNFLHEGIRKMPVKSACKKCHRKSGLIDFKALGFSEKKAEELKNIALEKIVANYETFHIPQVFMK